MGLSKRATCITEENIGYYLQNIDNVKLDSNIICDMVKNMMKRPYEGNYLKQQMVFLAGSILALKI